MTLQLLNKGDFVGYAEIPARAGIFPWHLVQVNCGSENTIAEYLRRHSFEVYAPVTRVMKPVAMRYLSHKQRAHGAVVKRPKVIPLFPGYLFVAFDMGQSRWHEIFKLRSVRGLVCAGDLPAKVPGEVVLKLRASEIDGAVPGALKLIDLMQFDIGDDVTLQAGPFADFPAVIEHLPRDYLSKWLDGTIEELDESVPVTLLVSIFGRSTPVQTTIGEIEKRTSATASATRSAAHA